VCETFREEKMSFGPKISSGQERRAVGSGGILIGLSKETSPWAEIQNLVNV
jgi:hypothetical protein